MNIYLVVLQLAAFRVLGVIRQSTQYYTFQCKRELLKTHLRVIYVITDELKQTL